jgi:hypothetical protein
MAAVEKSATGATDHPVDQSKETPKVGMFREPATIVLYLKPTATNNDRRDRRTTHTRRGTSQHTRLATTPARIRRTTAVKEIWPAGSIGS